MLPMVGVTFLASRRSISSALLRLGLVCFSRKLSDQLGYCHCLGGLFGRNVTRIAALIKVAVRLHGESTGAGQRCGRVGPQRHAGALAPLAT
jgi:hypothetical protein